MYKSLDNCQTAQAFKKLKQELINDKPCLVLNLRFNLAIIAEPPATACGPRKVLMAIIKPGFYKNKYKVLKNLGKFSPVQLAKYLAEADKRHGVS